MLVFHGTTVAAIFWIVILAIVCGGQFFSYRERTSRHRMIETLAQKGQPIPPELLNDRWGSGRGWRHGSPVQSGIYLMCVGVALALFFWALSGGGNFFDGENVPNWLPFVGIFPFMIGLARILAGILDRKPAKQE